MQDAHYIAGTELVILFHGEIVNPPDIEKIVTAHFDGQADMTIFFNPDHQTADENNIFDTAQCYICSDSIIKHVAVEGYCDIKESLVPKLVQIGTKIKAVDLDQPVGEFRDWSGFLSAESEFLLNDQINSSNISESAVLDNSVSLIGPIKVCNGAKISKDATVIGPSIIGPDVTIYEGASVSKSILWDKVKVGANSYIHKSLISHNTKISQDVVIERTFYSNYIYKSDIIITNVKKILYEIMNESGKMRDYSVYVKWIICSGVMLAFILSYWNNLFRYIFQYRIERNDFSPAILILLMVGFMVYKQRQSIIRCRISPAFFGAGILLLAQSIRFLGILNGNLWFEGISMIVTLVALIIFMFGWEMFKEVWIIILAFSLMLFLPEIRTNISLPLWSRMCISALLVTVFYSGWRALLKLSK